MSIKIKRKKESSEKEITSYLDISKEQSEQLNIFKAFLAIMVVFIHAYQSTDSSGIGEMNYVDVIQYVVSQIICRCAVPSYFFLSAMFLYRKPFNYKTNLVKKLKTLGVPYLIMNTVWVIIYLVFRFIIKSDGVSQIFAIDNVQDFLGVSGYPLIYPLWFLRDLLALNVVSAIVGKVVEKIPVLSVLGALSLWMILKSTTAWIFIPNVNNIIPVPLSGLYVISLQSVVFWVLGCAFCKMKIKLSVTEKVPFSLLSVVYLLFVFADMLTIGKNFNFIIHNAGIVVGLIFWYVFSGKVSSEKTKQFLRKLSMYSFGVYIFHEMSLTLLKNAVNDILPQNTVISLLKYFIVPIITISGCVILCVLLKRFVPKVYNVLTGSRG